jgi:putative ABC transport system ATP-binding protein
MDGDGDTILEARNLYHVYESKAEDGNVVALRGLHVKIRPGEAIAVIGPSGSGKSTLLKCLGGLMKPSAGSVYLGGQNITRLTGRDLVDLRQQTISFIFQEGNLLSNLSALDNVIQPLRHQGVPAKEGKRRATELLTRLGLAERMHARPMLLSGGEQQRVAIARALITKPKIILADEPTGALDPITSRDVLSIFRELHEKDGVSFFVVTHSAETADFCDRVLELRDGRFVAQHGKDLEIEDLTDSRELIIDEIGMLSLPPDILLSIGGAGRYAIESLEDGRIVLASSEDGGPSLMQNGGVLAASCPACDHDYGEDEDQACPECGSSRPVL